jgi:hypothetical protein
MYFQMHFFICTRFAQKSPSRNSAGQACPFLESCLLQAGFARSKKEELAPSRQGLRQSYRATTISLRLCVFARRKKNSSQSRQAAKASGGQVDRFFLFSSLGEKFIPM